MERVEHRPFRAVLQLHLELYSFASRLEVIAFRLEVITGRLEAIAFRLEAITGRLEAIA